MLPNLLSFTQSEQEPFLIYHKHHAIRSSADG